MNTLANTPSLVGVGLYTPSEAGRLLSIRPSKIRRWLQGHRAGGQFYQPLWQPQVDLADGSLHLGFRDLMELRTSHLFMEAGLSAQSIRRVIELAREIISDERPLSTSKFKTDGRSVFLELAEQEGDPKLLDIFKGQYVLSKIVERSLRNVDFDGIVPSRWWVGSRRKGIVIDPDRSFGQPIDDDTGVPTSILAQAASTSGSISEAARHWDVPKVAVRRAVEFEAELGRNAA